MDYINHVLGEGGVLAQHLSGYEVRSGQMELARAIDSSIEGGRSLVAEGPTGCHAQGQRILMFDGTTLPVEDIRVGDLLMGPDSKPREVLRLHRGEGRMERIEPVKGGPWTVDLDHVLTLSNTGTGELRDVTVRVWKGWSKTQKHLWKLIRTGVDFPSWRGYDGEKGLPLDPYFLGVLLGDGSLCKNGSVSVTKEDKEILECVSKQAEQFGMFVRSSPDKPGQYYLTAGPNSGSASNPVIAALRTMGLYKAGAGEKFVPHPYKVASRADRLALVAGLMDTDGSYENSYDYVSKSKRLVDDLTFVARSLGFAAYPAPCTKRCQTGFEGEYFRVYISGELSEIPCRIPRKKARKREQIKSVLRTGFSTTTVRDAEYFGFTVSSDGRYLLDDFTITHNCGKSFAYLIPAIQHLGSKTISKVIVATANIALQEQLIDKDLPALQRMLPYQFSYGLLKGRGNYLCLLKLEDFVGKQMDFEFDDLKRVKEVIAWSNRTETGDKSELDFEFNRWPMVSSQGGECLGRKCPHSKECFANQARRRAVLCDVVVCNYHVLLAAKELIPPHEVLICDEAHDLEDTARSALGWKISQWTFKKIADWITPHQGEQGGLANRLRMAADVLFEDVSEAIGKWDNFRLQSPDWAHGMDALIELLKRAATVAARVANNAVNEVDEGRAEKMGELIGDVINQLYGAKTLENDEWVYWLSKDRGGRGRKDRFYIQGAPILVHHILPGVLYEDIKTAVFISATMTSGNSFEYIRSQLGIPESAGELIAPSPFDLKRQGILVVPKDMPLPDTSSQVAAEEFYDAVADYALELIELCGGRSLLLFTSWRSLNHAHTRLVRAQLPFTILKQGEAPRMKLLEQFKRDVQSVLLGVASFWQGVDVPGESLTGLLIDKIPFPVPTDPIQAAIGDYIERQGGRAFFDRSVPYATIALAQGIGRLIRSKSDRGIVMICDKRLITKEYGAGIIRALPKLKKVRSFEAAQDFLSS